MNDLLRRSFSGPRSYVDLKRDSRKQQQDVEMAGMQDVELGSSDGRLRGFLEQADGVRRQMEGIRQLLLKLEEANEESKAIHKAGALRAVRKRMDSDVERVLKLARSIKSELEEMDRANVANRRVQGCEEGTPTDRTRTSVTATLRTKLKDLMADFQRLRQLIKSEYKETIERRYFTVTGQQPEEAVIEQMIDTGESETFLRKAIQEQGRGQVMDTVQEIQERHDAAKEIEKNLLELHQIFLDMAVLVEAQGAQLNDIEQQVNRAASYVERGTTNLVVAKKHQRSARKWTCIAIIILLVVILIIVLPIVVKFRNNSKNSSSSNNNNNSSPPAAPAPPGAG